MHATKPAGKVATPLPPPPPHLPQPPYSVRCHPYTYILYPQSEQRALNAEPNSASQLEVSPLPRTSSTMHVIEDRGRRNRGSKKGRRSRQPKVVPSGTSLNWIDALLTGRGDGPGGGGGRSVQAEVTLSATGRMQGAVSKGILTTRMRYAA